MTNKNYQAIVDHYEDCLEKFGDSHLGVDWPKEADVFTRYEVMLDVMRQDKSLPDTVHLLDFGCGAAHLLEYIGKKGSDFPRIQYTGLDISEKFISLCRTKYPEQKFICGDVLENEDLLPEDTDYIIMNGVFTEKRSLSNEEMFAYFEKMLGIAFKKAKRGIAFNVMSKVVDWERDDLFHVSFDGLANFMAKNLSRHFVFRGDYGLYEYTTYLYKQPNTAL